MPEGIKVVLFDLGNVLVDFDFNLAAKRIVHFCDKSPSQIFNLFFNSSSTALFETGSLEPLDFFAKIKEDLNLNLSYEAFVPIWNEIFFLSAKNRAVYSLVNCLSQNYKTALISNINILHYHYLKERFPVFNVFGHIFLSYELGLAKPNPLIYEHVLRSLGVLAQEVFYTDDRAELVRGAQDLGIKAFVFSGIKQLKADLLGIGITVD